MGKLSVVVGGQYGSEAKGHVAGWLASAEHNVVDADYTAINQLAVDQAPIPVLGVRVAGPNAGHTAYDDLGREWKLQQVPVAAVTNRSAGLLIADGSEIDWDTMQREVVALEAAGLDVISRLMISAEATVIEAHHVYRESQGREHGQAGLTKNIGSTGKGVGAARADRAVRLAVRAGNYDQVPEWAKDCIVYGRGSGEIIEDLLGLGTHVVIEGTQGYGLGTHAGHYPFVTSSDCRAIDFLSMAGVSPWHKDVDELDVWVVFRVYPIRVAGNSGPLQGETNWDALGLPEERTTVTKKVRRVGEWDPELAEAAVRANGGSEKVKIALMMADQKIPDLRNERGAWSAIWERSNRQHPAMVDLNNLVAMVENSTGGAKVQIIGTGPDTHIDWK